jgi:hypothetical protein
MFMISQTINGLKQGLKQNTLKLLKNKSGCFRGAVQSVHFKLPHCCANVSAR